jgi:methylsterol monooxygenase
MLMAATLGFYLGTNLLGLLLSWAMVRGWAAGRRLRGKAPTLEAWKKRLPLVAFNVVMVSALTALGFWMVGDGLIGTSTPVWWQALGWFFFFVVVDDVCMYAQHRLLHEVPWLYKHIHQLHHRAFPSVPSDYIYAHPLEVLSGFLGITLAFAINVLVMGEISLWSLVPYFVYRTLHELEIHSGLHTPWGWGPFAEADHHDQHHARPHSGNYASAFRFWDWALGTLTRPEARGPG